VASVHHLLNEQVDLTEIQLMLEVVEILRVAQH
jgi:hypothetical protein